MCSTNEKLLDEILGGPLTGGPLDDDSYKRSMGEFIRQHFPAAEARFALRNRTTGERLADIIPADTLAAELERIRTVRDGLPPFDLSVEDGQFCLTFEGLWPDASRWEIPALATVNGLRFRAKLLGMSAAKRQEVIATGVQRLDDKIQRFGHIPEAKVIEFGSRRRAHHAWQRYVNKRLARELAGQYVGTSNMECAAALLVPANGTMAHELFMVVAALMGRTDRRLLASHNRVLRLWQKTHGLDLSVALTDTFGSDFFFRDFTQEQAREWKGLRHDSGDPFAFGHRAIAFYRQLRIDPREKTLVFSDGLDMDMIERLWHEFNGKIGVTFGFGTKLTNDLGIPPVSIVIKAVAARQHADATWVPTVKLSDNLDKATGPNEEVERYKRVFGYVNDHRETCVV